GNELGQGSPGEAGGSIEASSTHLASPSELMRNYRASARWAGEIEPWVREWLTFAAASLLMFTGASRPRPRMGAPTVVRAGALFTSTMRSGNGRASNGPTCSP